MCTLTAVELTKHFHISISVEPFTLFFSSFMFKNGNMYILVYIILLPNKISKHKIIQLYHYQYVMYSKVIFKFLNVG